MKTLISLLISLVCFQCQFFSQALSPEQKAFYLLDTLAINELSESDSLILDSCLNVFHEVGKPIEQIEALNYICENLGHNDWERYQLHLHSLILTELENDHSSKTTLFLQKSLTSSYHNLGNITAGREQYEASRNSYGKSIMLARQIGDSASVAEAMAGLGNIYYKQGDLENALELFKQVEVIQSSIDDQEGLVLTRTALGIFSQIKGELADALEYHHSALSLAEQIGYKKGIASCLGNIGTLYAKMGDSEESINFLEQALILRRELGDPYSIDLVLRNIGSQLMGASKYGEARKLFDESINLNAKFGRKKALAQDYLNLGIILHSQDSLDRAMIVLQKSGSISQQINDKRGITECKRELGSIYLKKGMLKKAEATLLEAMAMSKDLGFLGITQRAAFKLSEVYQKLGNHKSEVKYFRMYVTARDSMQKKENVKTATRMLVSHEMEKKQLLAEQEEKEWERQEFLKIQRRDRLQYSVLFFVVFLFFLIIVFSGRFNLPDFVREGLLFFFLLLVFEFVLVLTDPMLDPFTRGEPFRKLLSNAVLAIAITPLHSLIERFFKQKLTTNS